MNQHEREYFISRIRSGNVIIRKKGLKLIITPPTLDQAIDSCAVYDDSYRHAEVEGVMTESEMEQWMIQKGFWSHEDEEKIEGLKAKLLAGLEAGSSLEDIAKENQLKVDSYKSINRDSSLFTRNVLLEIFNEPKSSIGKSYSYASMLNGDEIVFRLDKVTQLNTEVSDEEKDSLKNFFLEDRAETELVTLQTSMQEFSSVTVN